ncbi:MAG: SH3 beta-barrel fold-containing protein [Tannerellaceae bacterium]|nr:SH3 beta-barrel fold-containing protein [Tannerellaceae bacterium]
MDRDRSKVFKIAREMEKATGKRFSVCLARSWQLYRLLRRMRQEDEVVFAYEKANGALRRARGTLKNIDGMVKGTGKENYKSICYFDVDAQAFRSFKVENLITMF